MLDCEWIEPNGKVLIEEEKKIKEKKNLCVENQDTIWLVDLVALAKLNSKIKKS